MPVGFHFVDFCDADFSITPSFGANGFLYVHRLATCSTWQPGAVNYAACRGLKVFFSSGVSRTFYLQMIG